MGFEKACKYNLVCLFLPQGESVKYFLDNLEKLGMPVSIILLKTLTWAHMQTDRWVDTARKTDKDVVRTVILLDFVLQTTHTHIHTVQ